jgi:hypothetical protein
MAVIDWHWQAEAASATAAGGQSLLAATDFARDD